MRGLLLYAAAHLVMVLLVTDVLDAGGLDDLMMQDKEVTRGMDDLPGRTTKMRKAAAITLGGYVEVVRENDAADCQALEARLAPVLALALG